MNTRSVPSILIPSKKKIKLKKKNNKSYIIQSNLSIVVTWERLTK